MTAVSNVLLVGLAGLILGWAFALRALAEISPWGPLVGMVLLSMAAVGVLRAARL
jgi:hypothetical protein